MRATFASPRAPSGEVKGARAHRLIGSRWIVLRGLGLREQLRRLGWLALWSIAKYTLQVLLTAPIFSEQGAETREELGGERCVDRMALDCVRPRRGHRPETDL